MPRTLRLAAAWLAAATLVACGGVAQQVETVAVVDAAASGPFAVDLQPVEQAAARAAWAVPPVPVPLPAATLAEIRESPELLADRRLPTVSALVPPSGERFGSTTGPVTPEIRERMGESWSEACPVGLEDLRYLTVTFRGFDGLSHTGELVVHATAADAVVEVFRALYAEDFPIEEMRLITTADHHAPPTGDGNNTAAYNCRKARGQSRWSAHAYGTAVDINPFQNPMVRRSSVVPELGAAYVDRSNVRPGMLTPDGPAVRAFTAAGWVWGGDWTYSKDYMHFSTDGS
ncbi:MAG TPA: M15 family metallopeptidase [Mycobacteriales bacterium]|nr:M15 family metallopeptidase [Mycobacteriales bacterium]